MNELKDILLEQIRLHPAMGAGDLVKLIYQNEFGCGHLIDDPARALDRLKSELKMTPYEPEKPLFEPIGNDLMRLSLAAFPSCSLSEATLGAMFVYTANTVSGALPRFQEKLELLRGLVKSGEITCCTPDELEAYLVEYARKGYPAASHTPAYREAENPAYRVISADFARFLPFFQAVDALPGEHLLIGIDGRCASGKSTLGRLAANVYGASLIPMDDFFLPPERKTKARLSEPGGNVDYERFASEVLAPFKKGETFSYRPYRCHPVPGFLEPVEIAPKRLTIVEGSYSCHPYFERPYQLSVFMTTDARTQRERILRRNGAEMLERFVNTWIPLEEAYFTACRTQECADLVLRT